MTAAAKPSFIEYIENAVTVDFAVPYRFNNPTHVKAQRIAADGTVTVLTYGVDYSVTGGSSDAGGTLTVTTAVAVGVRLQIRRATPRDQSMNYATSDTFPAESHEGALDKAMLIDQEQDEAIGDVTERALMVPVGEAAPTVPALATLANKFLTLSADASEVLGASGTGSDPDFRNDFADPDLGTRMAVWNPGTPQSINTTAFDKLGDIATARERGGGPLATTAKNTSVFTELFGTPMRGRIWLDPVTYDIGANYLNFNLSNTWVKGVRGLTKITTTALGLLFFAASSDNIFEDIIFEVSAVDAGTSDYRGVVNMFHAIFQRHTFIRCVFRAPNCGLNAFKIIVEPEEMHDPGQEGVAESIHFFECIAEDVGRMGLEVQNHGHEIADTTLRYFDIVWDGGLIKDTGLVDSVDGQGISFSGYGSDCRVNTTFDNTVFACIEGVGVRSSKFSGRVRNQMGRPSDPLSFTNTLPMSDLTIEDFKTIGQADGNALLRTITGLSMRGNVLDISGYVDVTNVSKLKSYGDAYKTRHPAGLYINGANSKANLWQDLLLDRSEVAPGASGALSFDNGANGNLFRGFKMIPAGDGVMAENNGGSFNNWIIDRRDLNDLPPDDAQAFTRAAFAADANAVDTEQYAASFWEAGFITITSGVALTATRTLQLPKNVPGIKRVKNDTTGAQSITLAKSGGAGATVTIAAGASAWIAVTSAGVVSI